MSKEAEKTLAEIEETREELARKVDDLVGRAKVEAAEAGKKLALGAVALAGLVVVGLFAKRRVGR